MQYVILGSVCCWVSYLIWSFFCYIECPCPSRVLVSEVFFLIYIYVYRKREFVYWNGIIFFIFFSRVRVGLSPQAQTPRNRRWVKEKILMILNGQWRKKENLNENVWKPRSRDKITCIRYQVLIQVPNCWTTSWTELGPWVEVMEAKLSLLDPVLWHKYPEVFLVELWTAWSVFF